MNYEITPKNWWNALFLERVLLTLSLEYVLCFLVFIEPYIGVLIWCIDLNILQLRHDHQDNRNPSANWATPKQVDKIDHYLPPKHNQTHTVCILPGSYRMLNDETFRYVPMHRNHSSVVDMVLRSIYRAGDAAHSEGILPGNAMWVVRE